MRLSRQTFNSICCQDAISFNSAKAYLKPDIAGASWILPQETGRLRVTSISLCKDG